MKSIFLDIHGISVVLESTDSEFVEFVSQNLCYFVHDKTSDPKISVIVERSKKPLELKLDNEFVCYAHLRDKIYSKEKVSIFQPQDIDSLWLYVTAVSKDLTEIRADYSPVLNSIRNNLRNIYFKKFRQSIATQLYSTILRFSVIYPVLFFLELEKGIRFLHATSISKNRIGFIFAGLPGAGKTFLMESLVGKKDYRLITDSLTLLDANFLHPFPEMIRKDCIVKNDIFKYSGICIRGKFYHEVPKSALGEKVIYQKIFLVSVGHKTEIQRLNSSEGRTELGIMERLAKESREYSLIKFIMGRIIDFHSQTNKLDHILEDKDIYRLIVRKKEDDISFLEGKLKNGF